MADKGQCWVYKFLLVFGSGILSCAVYRNHLFSV